LFDSTSWFSSSPAEWAKHKAFYEAQRNPKGLAYRKRLDPAGPLGRGARSAKADLKHSLKHSSVAIHG
jgi:hypothetical protein